MTKLEILLLAAGTSSRMGQPKALLPIGQSPLIRHQLDQLQQLGRPITLVLGDHAQTIQAVLDDTDVNLVFNADYSMGMGHSIAAGVQAIIGSGRNPEAIMICAVDQPLIDSGHYNSLMEKAQQSDFSIIQSASDQGWHGIPTVFKSMHFQALTKLTGDQGAKSVIQKNPGQVTSVKARPGTLVDIDTPLQYRKFINNEPLSG
jgi:molybdenum cofactor cytidylyltransferase